MKKLCIENHYNLLHCHSPIGSVIARIAAKGRVDKVIYTAYGFHFYKGDFLVSLAKELNVNLHLLGYRTDIVELLNREDNSMSKIKVVHELNTGGFLYETHKMMRLAG